MDFLTPIIAIIALWIAYQQWQTNALRYRHELYERRLKVYKSLVGLLNEAHDANTGTVAAVQDALLESHFLFGKEIPEFIETTWRTVNDIAKLNTIMNDGHSDLTMKKNWNKLIDQINQMREEVTPLFSSYLKLT